LGDTGSLILGIVIAIFTIRFISIESVGSYSFIGYPALALSILIFPVIDTLRVFSIRILHGKSPFSPDMNHIHHHLLKLTNNHLNASLIIISANLLIIFLGFKLVNLWGNNVTFFFILALGAVLSQMPIVIYNRRNRVLKSNSKESIFAISLLFKKIRNKQ
jgi:hypothetical protein